VEKGMSGEVFYRVNEWVILGGLLALLLTVTELGFRLGRRAWRRFSSRHLSPSFYCQFS
jgi:hypothetical protein